MMSELNHTHCHHFCPIDVAKGICRLSGDTIMTDSPLCDEFCEKPRCGLCCHFCDQTSPSQCHGLEKPYWVDEGMNAGLCPAFSHR